MRDSVKLRRNTRSLSARRATASLPLLHRHRERQTDEYDADDVQLGVPGAAGRAVDQLRERPASQLRQQRDRRRRRSSCSMTTTQALKRTAAQTSTGRGAKPRVT